MAEPARGGERYPGYRIFLSECAWQASRGLVTRDYKFIRTVDSGPFNRPARELYDLRMDAEETENIADCDNALADEFESRLDAWVDGTLGGRPDPMKVQVEAGLPFKNRIHEILQHYGLTWDDWLRDPRRDRFDEAVSARHARLG